MLKLSMRDNRDLQEKAKNDIEQIKIALKKEPIIQKAFKQYNRNINDVDKISISFDDKLDVSAKTVNGKIFLNSKMLKDNWKDYFHYAIHECIHYLQHTSGECKSHEQITNENYLDNKNEIEAFQKQISYRKKTEPKSEVNTYLNDLLDKHEIPKDERNEKKKELSNNADDRDIADPFSYPLSKRRSWFRDAGGANNMWGSLQSDFPYLCRSERTKQDFKDWIASLQWRCGVPPKYHQEILHELEKTMKVCHLPNEEGYGNLLVAIRKYCFLDPEWIYRQHGGYYTDENE